MRAAYYWLAIWWLLAYSRTSSLKGGIVVTREPRAQATGATGALNTGSYGSTEGRELRKHRRQGATGAPKAGSYGSTEGRELRKHRRQGATEAPKAGSYGSTECGETRNAGNTEHY